jgi:uncharacterized metal-binding protein
MQPVYVGDIGVIIQRSEKHARPADIDLDTLDFRQLCNLAVYCGIDVRDLIGIRFCYEHVDMTEIGARALPQGYNLFESCKYCKNCWRFFRIKNLEDKIQ